MSNVTNSSYVPYANYPYNAIGANNVTKDIASYSYDGQRPDVAKTYEFLTSEHKPSYTWPVIGTVVSAISLIVVSALKFKK